MPPSALSPEAAVERLGAMSGQVTATVLLDEGGDLVARAGVDRGRAGLLRELAHELFGAADAAGARAGVEPVGRVEVTRPEGGVFGMRERDRRERPWTLLAVAAAGALPSLVLYDMRMTLHAIGGPE